MIDSSELVQLPSDDQPNMAESVPEPTEVIGSTDEDSPAARGASKELMVTVTAERSEVRAPGSNGAVDSPLPADVRPGEGEGGGGEEESPSVGGASEPGDAL